MPHAKQRRGEQIGGARSTLGRDVEACGDERAQCSIGDLGHRRRRREASDGVHRAHRRHVVKQRSAGRHRVRRRADGPDVDGRRVATAGDDLWRQEARRSTESAESRLRIELRAQSKAAQLYVSSCTDEHRRRFHVAMHDVLRVTDVERRHDAKQRRLDRANVEQAERVNHVLHVAPRRQLHHDIQPILEPISAVIEHDVRRMQTLEYFDLVRRRLVLVRVNLERFQTNLDA